MADQEATDEDIAAMRDLMREALDAGAVGFTTGRSDNHRSARGEATPASEAAARELAGIATAFAGRDHGALQAVSDFNVRQGDDSFAAEFDILEHMVAAAGGRPFSISTMQRDHSPEQWRWIMQRAEKMAAGGQVVRCQVAPRAIGIMLGLEATFQPFMGFPTYKTVHHLPLAERVRAMGDPAFKARLLQEKSDKVSVDGSPISPLADYFLSNLDMLSRRLFRLGERPNYEPHPDDSFTAAAERRGVPVLSLIYDALLEQEGKALLYFPLYNYTGMNLDTVHEMLTHPLAIAGLSDGGAHVGTVCDASFPTFLLQHWGRDRERGRLPIEHLVHMQTGATAAYIGMHDRGVLETGRRADVNVIDFERLALRSPEMQHDLPAGGQRLMQRADGYIATLVAGEPIVENGCLTGARPGRLARSRGRQQV